MGGAKSPDCNSLARQIWDYCVERHIWISASHLPGCENTEADRESRHFNDRTEWQLASKLVSQIAETIGSSSIDDHSQGSPPESFRVPETSPIEEKAESVSLSFVRRLYKNRGFSERATNIVLQSWRQSSQKQYDAHIRKWLLFCTKRQADPICPTIIVAVDFLTSLYDE